MIGASFVFWLVCGAPLVFALFYLLKKDKVRGKLGMVILALLVIAALAVILYITKDFSPTPYRRN